MSDVTSVTTDVPEPQAPARPRGRKRRFALRWSRRLSLVVAGVVAATLISFFSIDIGRIPGLRAIAEREASKYLERPMHIGRIRAYAWPGRFALEDVRIEGKTPDAKPFFVAKRILIDVPWRTLFRKELIVEVELRNWDMVIETWAGGHNMPKLAPRSQRPPGPRPFRTTVPFVHAKDGRFQFYDHATPWNVIAPNLNFSMVRAANLNAYVGTARFDGGTVRIQNFLPMQASMSTTFALDGRLVRLRHIDLLTDGAESHINGTVDFGNWPNQQYNVDSTVDFPRMRELFFAHENWQLAGEGRFKGVFQLAKGGYYNLSGNFTSEELGFNQWRFPDLHGALEWKPGRFAVTHADSHFEGGNLRLFYGLDKRTTPTAASLTAEYDGVSLLALTRKLNWDVLQPDGRVRGSLAMHWPNGRFSSAVTGGGTAIMTPPEGATVAPAALAESAPAPPLSTQEAADRPMGRIPLAGDVTYEFDAGSLIFSKGWAATPSTYTTFSGRAHGGPADMNFHVTSHDWQDSDRLFVAIMNQFGSTPTAAIPVSGRGTFDGALTGSFRAPKIAGAFASEGMGAWDVMWGRTAGAIVMEHGYMTITDGVITNADGATIKTSGRYALGYRGGEELNATVQVANWPLTDFRHAFELDDWPAEGVVTSADFTLKGPYREPRGEGPLRIDHAVAWGESFDSMTGYLLFEGTGLRVRSIVLAKGRGRIESEAFLDWQAGTYIFDAKTPADGRIPLESLATLRFDLAPLTGMLNLQKVHGEGAFERPTYTIDASVADLYAGGEGVGQVQARLVLRDEVLTFEHFDVASSRLQAFGAGSIALNEHLDARLFLRFADTSLDPYIRLVAPARMSDFAQAIASGSINITGPLANRSDVVMTAKIDPKTTLRLSGYPLSNAQPIELVYEDDVFKVVRFELQGENTQLKVTGQVDAGQQTIDLNANGQADLAILQLFYSDLSANGPADLSASLKGAFGKAELSGAATIRDGRLKPHAFAHGFVDLNGVIRVTANRITLEGLPGSGGGMTGVIGEGPMTLTGGITLNNDYEIDRYDLVANGRSVHLRVPRGLASTVDARLALTGPASRPVLSGKVDVLTAMYRAPGDTITDLLMRAAGGSDAELLPPSPPPAKPSGVALEFDIDVHAPVMPFLENQLLKVAGSASVHIGGTYDRPAITGWLDIDSGEAKLFGNRYVIRSGSRVDFLNPAKFEPYFSIEANTRVRAQDVGTGQSQTFSVDLRFTGTTSSFSPTFNSDPWLPPEQIISLLLGESPNFDADLKSLQSRQDLTTMALRSAMATLLTTALSSRVTNAVANPIVDMAVTPVLGREMSLQQMSPDGRLILTKAVSPKLWVMYARTFQRPDEVIRVEYDQSERLTWVLTRNEDRTFSVEIRFRRVF
jgi:hypothetical protein